MTTQNIYVIRKGDMVIRPNMIIKINQMVQKLFGLIRQSYKAHLKFKRL